MLFSFGISIFCKFVILIKSSVLIGNNDVFTERCTAVFLHQTTRTFLVFLMIKLCAYGIFQVKKNFLDLQITRYCQYIDYPVHLGFTPYLLMYLNIGMDFFRTMFELVLFAQLLLTSFCLEVMTALLECMIHVQTLRL